LLVLLWPALTLAEPVRFCVDPDWPPYEIIDEHGRHQGIAADLLREVADRVGLELSLVRTANWEESLNAAQDGRCQFLSFLNATPARAEWLDFTNPVFVDPNVIVTREDHAFVSDLAALTRETLVLPRGTSIEERLRRDFPNLTILITETEAEAFAMVSSRQADMTLRSLIVAVYTIKKEGWFNLKVSGQVPGYDNLLRIGVRRGHGDLVERLNQGIATIDLQERAAIANRHVSITVRTGVDPVLVRNLVAIFGVILITSFFWALKLKTVNAELKRLSLTDRLTSLGNRAFLNDHMAAEIPRSKRYGRPFSIILLDLDYFKAINDQFGHLTGDKVLVAFAAIMRAQARQSDILGRWGGEEFLILCPDTNQEQAVVLGERIRQAMASHVGPTSGHHTVSAGIATLRDTDTPDSLLAQADQALYQAKAQGRNRVVSA